MERVARQAREFREEEAKKIAAEKEVAKLAFEKQKQEELELVASLSGISLEEADKLRKAEEKAKSSIKEANVVGDSNVSAKAKLLSEKEDMERKRLEDQGKVVGERRRKSPTKAEGESSAILNPNVSTLDDKYVQNLAVRRFDRRSFPPKHIGRHKPDDDPILIGSSVRKEASFELPVEYTENGLILSKEAEVFMVTTMPPSRVHGRWSGTLEGRSSLSSTSSANGSFSLDYKSSRSTRLSFGLIRGHEAHYPLITLGLGIIRGDSSVAVTYYHNATFLHAMLLEHSMYSLSFSHLFPNSRWIFISELSRRQKLSVSLSNSKLSGRMGWNLRKPKDISLRLDVRPTISEHRKAHVFGEWKLGGWQVGASLVQSLGSQIASVGLGLRLLSSRGLEWVFSWNRGDCSIKIPIIICRELSKVHLAQYIYFSMVSFIIQEGLADMWESKLGQSEEEESTKTSGNSVEMRGKGRDDAELQRELMTRQAKRKKREEAEKEGLVIQKATYQVEGGDEWDATIPLQFWVTRSSLTFPPTSKSQLLGFYDVTADLKRNTEASITSSSPYSWNDMWRDLLDMAPKAATKSTSTKRKCPTLTVRYDFKGQPYSMSVKDLEELKLPNPRATRL